MHCNARQISAIVLFDVSICELLRFINIDLLRLVEWFPVSIPVLIELCIHKSEFDLKNQGAGCVDVYLDTILLQHLCWLTALRPTSRRRE